MTDKTERIDTSDMEDKDAHNKMVSEAQRIITKSKPGDRVAVLVDSAGSMSFATNAGGQGVMSMIEVLTMQIGRIILEENEGRTDVPYHEAFLYGSMSVAKVSMERAKQMQEAAHEQEQGKPNEQGGRHYADDVTDSAAGSDGAGNVH